MFNGFKTKLFDNKFSLIANKLKPKDKLKFQDKINKDDYLEKLTMQYWVDKVKKKKYYFS